MAQISVSNLTFSYEGGFNNIFENASFSIDSSWKLGFIGRNGRGKTTFARLLLGKYQYEGSIFTSNTVFDYFPYQIEENKLSHITEELFCTMKPGCEAWRVICELNQLDADTGILYRPFNSLSHGERTKVMLAVLFSGENNFLIIDEPTNHLDFEARLAVKEYLRKKKGFILISHDRDLLDACIDHVLVLNRKSIEVQNGSFSSWWENKQKKDMFSESENEKHLKEIASLKRAADRTLRWAQKSENSKIGYDPVKEHDRGKGTRSYVGEKARKMQARAKSYEVRMEREIEEKEGLLEDIEKPVDLKLMPKSYHKETLIYARNFGLRYVPLMRDGTLSHATKYESPVIEGFNFELKSGERVFLHGSNGCGKSSFIKQVAGQSAEGLNFFSGSPKAVVTGELRIGSGLEVSYVSQDTSFLNGSIKKYCKENGLEESLMLSILRQLDMERIQFEKPMETYSEGQKKKILLAASILTPAHLYIWDEPLNYIDIFSRIQIEKMLLRYKPTLLIADHDVKFRENVATRVVNL